MQEDTPTEDDPYPDPIQRNAAFVQWYSRSPRHLRAFLQIYEIHRRADLIDRKHHLNVEGLLANRVADVIPLHKSETSAPAYAARITPVQTPSNRRLGWAIAAAGALVATTVLLAMMRAASHEFSTGIGEQRTAKLEDGSIVYLNTNTRIVVDFSKRQRNLRLLEGEALFVVEHDSTRPFIVTADNARVRAVGTQFNVRERPGAVDVAVVEGVVQVTAKGSAKPSPTTPAPRPDSPPSPGSGVGGEGSLGKEETSTRLAAGQVARITPGQVLTHTSPAIAETLSWRERRLIFHNATLGEVAAEFNRYNRAQITVVGAIAQERTFKAAIFDADRPQALILYSSKDPSLEIEADGDNWIIRAR
jgi:transmembrane sensor